VQGLLPADGKNILANNFLSAFSELSVSFLINAKLFYSSPTIYGLLQKHTSCTCSMDSKKTAAGFFIFCDSQ
jgi:hypothetical protein